MKNLEQLGQEAKQARDDVALALAEILPYGTGSVIADKLILASVAMVTYQFALGMQEVSGDGSGQSLSSFNQDEYSLSIGQTVVGKVTDLEFSPDILPEVSQEERDSDGWIELNSGSCPIDENVKVELKFRSSQYENIIDYAGGFSWHQKDDGTDIIAYRIVK